MFFQNVSKLYFLFSDFNKAEKLNEINNLEGVLLFPSCNGDSAGSCKHIIQCSSFSVDNYYFLLNEFLFEIIGIQINTNYDPWEQVAL